MSQTFIPSPALKLHCDALALVFSRGEVNDRPEVREHAERVLVPRMAAVNAQVIAPAAKVEVAIAEAIEQGPDIELCEICNHLKQNHVRHICEEAA